MKQYLTFLVILFSSVANAQIIDFNNFSEKRMNEVMFDEMNKYVKSIHNGDSVIWSAVVQQDVMADNYNFIRSNSSNNLMKLHNPKWLGRDWNDLPDTVRTKIITEMEIKFPQSEFLKKNKLENYEGYSAFTYTEILHSITFSGSYPSITYQEIARGAIKGWNNSPPHALYMNANYKNGVIVGVATVFDKKKRTIIISFVHVS